MPVGDRGSPPAERGTPVARRVVLASLGLARARASPFGARVQRATQRALLPITLHDPTGLTDLLPVAGSFRIYSVTALAAPPERRRRTACASTASSSGRSTLTLRRPARSGCPRRRSERDFQCVTGLAGRRRRLAGRAPGARARRGRRPAVGDPGAVPQLRRHLHREPQPRPGPAARRARGPHPAGQAAQPRARRPGAPLRRADVRLQVAQVARPHRARRPRRSTTAATGRVGATTSTAGSGTATAATRRRSRDRVAGAVVLRFDRLTRVVHWTTAGARARRARHRDGPLRARAVAAIGLREVLKDVHVTAALLLPVPLAGRRPGRRPAGRRPAGRSRRAGPVDADGSALAAPPHADRRRPASSTAARSSSRPRSPACSSC